MVTKDFENFILNHQIFVIKNGLDILKISIIVARCNIVTKLVGWYREGNESSIWHGSWNINDSIDTTTEIIIIE